MDYKKFNDKIFARFDRGEEVMTCLETLAKKENIKLASITAIGAASEIVVGVYNVGEKKYYSNTFKGDLEIVSLSGTITTKNGEYYPHLHLSAGDEKGNVFGGHLNKAVISGTCEMVITLVNGKVDRMIDDKTGLNVFKF